MGDLRPVRNIAENVQSSNAGRCCHETVSIVAREDSVSDGTLYHRITAAFPRILHGSLECIQANSFLQAANRLAKYMGSMGLVGF
jgi:hypothetical protein